LNQLVNIPIFNVIYTEIDINNIYNSAFQRGLNSAFEGDYFSLMEHKHFIATQQFGEFKNITVEKHYQKNGYKVLKIISYEI
jgi:hypothetical protein